MKKAAILLALIITLSGCGSAKPIVSSQAESSSELTSSEIAASEASSYAAVSEAIEKAASEVAASEAAKAASEAAVSEAAAKAASEAAAKAASEAAASEAAARAASEATVSEVDTKPTTETAVSKADPKTSSETTSSKATAKKTETKTVAGAKFLNNVEKSILTKINQEREAEGLEALTYNEDLRSAARIRSQELYKAKKFAHNRPNGDSWQTVLEKDVPVSYSAAGENLCMTEYNDPSNHSARSATFWVEQWMDSPPHYENIMRSEFTHAGVGVFYIEKDGMIHAYATMIFAQLSE